MMMHILAPLMAMDTPYQPHHLDYQKYWDKEGVLWWTQFSAHVWYDTPEFRENFKKLLRQWVKERRNSPSVVMWGLQNESTLPKAVSYTHLEPDGIGLAEEHEGVQGALVDVRGTETLFFF